jgi:hypothetical protein
MLVGNSNPVRNRYGALPGLSLEEQLDPGQPSPPLDSLNFDVAFRSNSPSVSREVLLNFLSILVYLDQGCLEKTSVEANHRHSSVAGRAPSTKKVTSSQLH